MNDLVVTKPQQDKVTVETKARLKKAADIEKKKKKIVSKK